jgi:hypothetical protein
MHMNFRGYKATIVVRRRVYKGYRCSQGYRKGSYKEATIGRVGYTVVDGLWSIKNPEQQAARGVRVVKCCLFRLVRGV